MGTWNGWLIILLTHFRFQFFKRQNMTPFLTVSFAILPRSVPKGHLYEKKEERLPFLLSSFLVFYFHLLLIVWLKRHGRATTWRKRRHQRGKGEWGGSWALIVAPHKPIHKVQLHTRWRSMSSKHPTPKEEGGCLRCYSCSLFCFLRLLILLILLCRGRLIES